MKLYVKRVYDPPAVADGKRVLVDRLWPRGLAKATARIDLWLKDAAPSTELRTWFHTNRTEQEEFIQRYRAELAANSLALLPLQPLLAEGTVTLLYSANTTFSNAHVLRDYLIAQS